MSNNRLLILLSLFVLLVGVGYCADYYVYPGQTITLSTTCSDDNDCDDDCNDSSDDLYIKWKRTDGKFTSTNPTESGDPITWRAPSSPGYVTITAVCNDDGAVNNDSPDSTSVTVTVVKVDKIQYDDPDTGYTDISGTLYVHKGTTVTFKSIPDPSGASWPSGKPVWGGVASGTGSTKAVTFNSLSSSTTDYKTVTAECGNTVSVNVIVFDFTGTLTPDVNFTSRSMSQYGVEETVSLSHTTDPSGITGLPFEWEKFSGKGSVSGSTYDAEAIAGDVTLKLKLTSGPSKGRYKVYSKTVVAPTNRFIHAASPWDGIWHDNGVHTCGIKGESYLNPKNVSFTNIQRREGTSPPATVTGHYLSDYGTPGPTHTIGSWFTPSSPNTTTGCYVVRDTTSTNHPCASLGDSGTFSWTIAYEYKGDDAVPRPMGNITASKEIESSGTTKVKKGSLSWFSKALGASDSEYYTGP
jgi:hypothetical protein